MSFVGHETITVWALTQGGIDPATGLGTTDSYSKTTGVLATVNPLTGEQTDTLPEGENGRHWRQVITEHPLRGVDDNDSDDGHIIEYRGDRYRVRSTKTYHQVIPHTEALVRRLSRSITLP